ncbi:MAG: hypothetical protein IPH12_19355 [Saprospirales bacterium]|nr:hypothetical protein [Saprospirales bacterium]
MAANEIPHPRTWVNTDEEEALEFAVNSALPLVGKMSVGGGGRGVCILRTRNEVLKYRQKYLLRRWSDFAGWASVEKKGFCQAGA